MQRLAKIFVAVAAIGLISAFGSDVMARGGGGGRSGGGAGMQTSGNRGNSNRMSQNAVSHPTSNQVVHPRGPKPNGKDGGRRRPGRRPRYHMYYPVDFWFDADLDDGDAEVAAEGIDVQFASIRQIDAGNPAKNLAPAYRVWFTNNSDVDIDQPFDVTILASTDEQLAKGLPYASMRVDGIGAGESASVDIRLPIEALKMGSDDDDAAPYAFLHTIIDSQRELVETNKANNVSVYDRNVIPPLVD